MWQGLFINFKKYKREGVKEYVMVGPFRTRKEVQRVMTRHLLFELDLIDKVWNIFQQLDEDGNRNQFYRLFGLEDAEAEIEDRDQLVELFGKQLVESKETLGQIKQKGEVLEIYQIPSI